MAGGVGLPLRVLVEGLTTVREADVGQLPFQFRQRRKKAELLSTLDMRPCRSSCMSGSGGRSRRGQPTVGLYGEQRTDHPGRYDHG